MRLPFLNRHQEKMRLQRILSQELSGLVVVYGRHRCGKSRLLQELLQPEDVYYVADQQAAILQIQSLAQELDQVLPNFSEAHYPSWQSLFSSLNSRLTSRQCLMIDELPYLVQSSPELPSILQKQIDSADNQIFFILCGSSQRMMQGLVLDETEPLYGRAHEILRLRALKPYWVQEALNCEGIEAIEQYAVWGGVPRYWELAKSYGSHEEALQHLVFDPNGTLYKEPMRLLSEDLSKGTIQAHSLLSIIAKGDHRLSKISSRIAKPANQLTRPLANLIDLDYIERQIPFGESSSSTKRSLYQLKDPFLLFWYRFVHKHRSSLEQGLVEEVYSSVAPYFSHHVAHVWEELARTSVAHLKPYDILWKPGQRWWGKGSHGQEMELDVVAESFDQTSLLIGEVKWEHSVDWKTVSNKLKYCAEHFPKKKKYKKVYLAYWSQVPPPPSWNEGVVHTPKEVLMYQ